MTCQPNRLNNACETISRRLHPKAMSPPASPRWSDDHIRIDAVALKITCKKLIERDLLKTQSFRQFQIAQSKAQTPTRIWPLSILLIPTNQFPNKFGILVGGGKLYATWTVRQIKVAKGQEIKRCWIVSSLSQKQHFLHPFQFRLAKLSLVRITSLWTKTT